MTISSSKTTLLTALGVGYVTCTRALSVGYQSEEKMYLGLRFALQKLLAGSPPLIYRVYNDYVLIALLTLFLLKSTNSILRGYTVESLIMPRLRLYAVQILRCDSNGIRQIHKHQLKAWLSLFFLITSEVVSCIQSSASSQMSVQMHL